MGRPTTHGTRQLERRWREQKLDPATVKILRALVDDIAEDAGGAAHLTTRELWLAECAAFCQFVIGQAMDFLIRRGSVVDDDGQFHPILGQYLVAWMNALRLNLVALGLRPDRADKVPSLEEYLRARQSTAATSPSPAPIEAGEPPEEP
jgi:hypothetical protein